MSRYRTICKYSRLACVYENYNIFPLELRHVDRALRVALVSALALGLLHDIMAKKL